ncbi:MAG: type II/IV secretion system protein [Myxococcus sp.]|nr:type II/IV secretion system protein [Myxococcus sp.]
METLSRGLVALSLLGIGVIVMALVLPDPGGLGPPPPPDAAVASVTAAVTQPLVLVALLLAAVLVLSSTGAAPSRPMSAAVSARLPPVPLTATTPERVTLTREAIAATAKDSSSGEQLLDLLIEGAARCGASDVHVQPTATGGEVAFRVDGQLEPMLALSHLSLRTLVNRLKVVAKLVHYKSDAPQDGQFSTALGDGPVDVRLSLLPTQHGEKAVLRLTGLGRQLPTLDALGLSTVEHAQLLRLLEKPQGLLFFTGPTGSGKTTTIYGALQHLRAVRGGNAQVATIEDPIELALPGAAQTQVNRGTGLDFASGLRAVLRQDPNIIVVGEIRDAETAAIAVQAGLTGHLILTTVHADSAAGVFNRLLEMGVEPAILASVSLASISQRLVRRLCPHCRAPHQPTPDEARRLTSAGLATQAFFRPTGCARCGGAGFIGRVAVFEVLEMTMPLREALRGAPSTQALMALARKDGTVPLLEAAVARAAEGVTSLDEAFRVAG